MAAAFSMISCPCTLQGLQQRWSSRSGLPRHQVARVPCKPLNVMAPSRPQHVAVPHLAGQRLSGDSSRPFITRETVQRLEAELDNGESIKALRRFNQLLRELPADSWEPRLRAVMGELAHNLESFNPAFTAVLLKVQSTIGASNYVGRDMALKNLIQPLAGEYGMHNGQEQGKTHRELFSEFYEDLLHAPLAAALAANPAPPLSVALFQRMMHDIMTGGQTRDPIEQASYAMGYNLAIEYLADYEKVWMLDSFRQLDARVLASSGRALSQWLFLEVHAEGEKEHAAIGHAAVVGFVPARHEEILRRAMIDHDRDFAVFYNALADMLDSKE